MPPETKVWLTPKNFSVDPLRSELHPKSFMSNFWGAAHASGVNFVLAQGVMGFLAQGVKQTWSQGASALGFST